MYFHFTDFEHVSDIPLFSKVYDQPAWLQSQPVLVQFLCPRCLPKLTEHRDQTRLRLVGDAAQGVDPACERTASAYSVCRGCAQAKVGDCHEMEPKMRRATNILWFLTLRAIEISIGERDNNPVVLHPFESADDTSELDEREKAWERVRAYAAKLATARNAWRLDLARTAGMSMKEWEIEHARRNAFLSARQVSRQHNLERHEKGYGPVGLARPNNVVADAELEQSLFSRTGSASHRIQRFFYYGTQVPGLRGLSPVPVHEYSPEPRTPAQGSVRSKKSRIDWSGEDEGVRYDGDELFPTMPSRGMSDLQQHLGAATLSSPVVGRGQSAVASPLTRKSTGKGKQAVRDSESPLRGLNFGSGSESTLSSPPRSLEEPSDSMPPPATKPPETPKAKAPKNWEVEVGSRPKSSRSRKLPQRFGYEEM